MRNLKPNATTDEIAKIVNEEKALETKDQNYSPEIYLALLTFEERAKLDNEHKYQEFWNHHKNECLDFEKKINKMLQGHHIDYRDFFEADYKYFFKTWVEDEGHSFDELWEMMKKVIEEYEYPFITYHILFVCFDDKYL